MAGRGGSVEAPGGILEPECPSPRRRLKESPRE